MSRPLKCRNVACEVPVLYFKPQGVPMGCLEEIGLALDEVEAMRLTDVEGLYQAEAAEKMGISRQTLGCIIARAHKKVATALLEGKALRIGGTEPSVNRAGQPCCDAEPDKQKDLS